jgi:hypothetical protein
MDNIYRMYSPATVDEVAVVESSLVFYFTLDVRVACIAHHTVQCINKIFITKELKIKLNGRYYDMYSYVIYIYIYT